MDNFRDQLTTDLTQTRVQDTCHTSCQKRTGHTGTEIRKVRAPQLTWESIVSMERPAYRKQSRCVPLNRPSVTFVSCCAKTDSLIISLPEYEIRLVHKHYSTRKLLCGVSFANFEDKSYIVTSSHWAITLSENGSTFQVELVPVYHIIQLDGSCKRNALIITKL